MIAERLPQLLTFSKEEKWQLMVELNQELMADDPTEQEPFKSELVQVLEERYQHYLAHPETASTWAEVSQKMRAQRK